MSMATVREQKQSLSALTDGNVVLRVKEKDMGQEDEQLYYAPATSWVLSQVFAWKLS